MNYDLVFKPRASQELEQLPPVVVKRVRPAIAKLMNDPRPPGCKKLSGSDNAWRLRIGDYRILYEVHDDELLVRVFRISHRKEAYR
jgi:mRNA interferase RelE/StbE